jgi:pimeloyl-ACP methyl ester carboxylesterase
MATFVLVHGGGHGGWCYSKLARLLRAAGHDVYAPSLSGCGDRKHVVTPETGLTTHVEDVANLLFYEDLSDVYLAGHSYGGMVITGAADRVPDRVAHLIYLDAAHPKNHEALTDVAPGMMAMAQSQLREANGISFVQWPDHEEPIAVYGVTDPLDDAWLRARLTPQPWKCFTEKLDLQDEARMRRIPWTNLNCLQSLRYSDDASKARMLDGSVRNYEIDTGHDLMVTEADWTAKVLMEIAGA